MSAEEKWIGPKALSLLRPGAFRRYIIGSLISDSGTWMQMMAQSWVMSGLTNKAILLGLVNFAAGLPALALAPVAGSLADRLDKRKILVATQIAQIIFAVALGFLVMSGQILIWHIIFFALLLGIAFSYEMQAISALVPELVKRDEIATAIALDRSVFHGSRLVGPSLAGIFVAWWGAASAFFANAGSFFALVIALISLPPRTLGTAEEEEQRRSGFKEGLLYVRRDRIILCMIVLIALTTIFVFPFLSVMLPLYVRNILKLGPERLGLLMAVSGTGALFGALGLLSVARDHRFRFMTSAVVLVALALLCMSQSNSFLLTAVSMGILAVGLSANFGLANTIVQERAPAALRGRVSAVFGLSFFGLMPIAGLLTTGLSDLIGMRTALGISAVLFGIFAVLILNVAGRTGCEKTGAAVPKTEAQPAAVA